MSESIIQKQVDDKEEKSETISKMRNEIEELKKRNKELEEQLQSYQTCRGEKRPRSETSEMLPSPRRHHETVINIIVDKAASSSSPFQGKLGRRYVQVVRRERPKSYPYSVSDHNVVGIEENVEKLVQQLINPKSGSFFAIVGMGGSGKTTLARKIYNHVEIRRYFDCRVWICVSQVWSEESILKDIFSQTTGRNSNNLTVREMVDQINKLLKDKPHLVVLDDVWKQDVLREIMVPMAEPRGSKFVITTRNQNVIQFSDLRFEEHTPRRLTRDQSLELFNKIAFDHQSNTTIEPFVDLAKEMLRKCDGLPLAVISLAGLLRRKKTIQEWMIVRNNVSSKIIEDHVGPSDYGRVEDILGLSYSDLNYTLKSCFMYLSLFPEDAVIPCGMLMRCWIAEGFFKSVWLAPNEIIEDVARRCLDELIQRCLVQVVKINYAEIAQAISVHDLLRDLALKKAKLKYFSSTLPSNSSPRPIMQCLRLLYISSSCNSDREKIVEDLGVCLNLNLTSTLNQDKVSRRLRSFIDWSNNHWLRIHLKTFFTNYSVLRVLILKDFEKDIPDAIGSLIHLRYLRLSFLYFDSTPYLPDSIQNLRNLLTFDCQTNGYWIESMPLPNLKQMKQLRYLRLPRVLYDYDGRPVHLRDLRNLKVLKGIKSGKWLMTELKYLSPTVEKLEIIDIKSSERLEQVYECPSIVEDNLCSLSLNCRNYNVVQTLRSCI